MNEDQNKGEGFERRLIHWIETQHGTAGWETKLENFIRQERQTVIREFMEKMEGKKVDDEGLRSTWEAGWNDAIDDMQHLADEYLELKPQSGDENANNKI